MDIGPGTKLQAVVRSDGIFESMLTAGWCADKLLCIAKRPF